MVQTTDSDPARGNTLRGIAIVSGGIYTVLAVIVAFGGSEASYQAPLWASWVIVMLVATGTFAVGSALNSRAPGIRTSSDTPVLTLVN